MTSASELALRCCSDSEHAFVFLPQDIPCPSFHCDLWESGFFSCTEQAIAHHKTPKASCLPAKEEEILLLTGKAPIYIQQSLGSCS